MLFVIKSGSEIKKYWLKIIRYALLHLVFAGCAFLILYFITNIFQAYCLLRGWLCVGMVSVSYTAYLFAKGTVLQPKIAFMRQVKALIFKHFFNVLMILLCLIYCKDFVGLTFIIGYIIALIANMILLVKLKF
jgi:hypothetical protein